MGGVVYWAREMINTPQLDFVSSTLGISSENEDLMSGKSALLIGATGAVGKHVLRELIASKEYTRVGEYGRRVTSKDQLGEGSSKLEQKTLDFEKLEDAGLKDGKWDVVFITYVPSQDCSWAAK